jgi:2-amino-4-hydroxy-6-hydroxymethyldihydropteridine diphosphokinase
MPLHRAYLSLGSNIEPERNLPAAVAALRRVGRVVDVSRVWASPAVGDASQPEYCNAAVCLETTLTAEELLAADGPLRRIEAELGRVRDPHNKSAPRTIDIDLSLLGDEARTIGEHCLPDPSIRTRSFVAVPLSELAGARLPGGEGPTLTELASVLSRMHPLVWRTDLSRALRRAAAG